MLRGCSVDLPMSAGSEGQIQGMLLFLGRASTPLAPGLECSILFLEVTYNDSSMDCMSGLTGRLLSRSGGLGRSISGGCKAVEGFEICGPDNHPQSKTIWLSGPQISNPSSALQPLEIDLPRPPDRLRRRPGMQSMLESS